MRFTFTLDSTDPERLATFWASALGYISIGEVGVFWPLAPTDESEPPLIIQRVTEAKLGKNRMHLDLHVADLSSEAARLDALGATRISENVITEHDHQWLVMADPDGNEFCVVQRPGKVHWIVQFPGRLARGVLPGIPPDTVETVGTVVGPSFTS